MRDPTERDEKLVEEARDLIPYLGQGDDARVAADGLRRAKDDRQLAQLINWIRTKLVEEADDGPEEPGEAGAEDRRAADGDGARADHEGAPRPEGPGPVEEDRPAREPDAPGPEEVLADPGDEPHETPGAPGEEEAPEPVAKK